jgi:hypothetical protein
VDVGNISYETCIRAESHRVPYSSSLNKCSEPVVSINEFNWFLLFVDECTRMIWVYLLKKKDEVPKLIKKNFNLIKK